MNTQSLRPVWIYLQFKSSTSQLLNIQSVPLTHIIPQINLQIKLQYLWQDSKKHGLINIHPGKALAFFRWSLNRFTFPTFRGIWHTIPWAGPGHRRSQRLFLKRSLRHVENICIAQHGLKSEPEASISPPCTFFKANKLKCAQDNVQSVSILHTQHRRQIGFHM